MRYEPDPGFNGTDRFEYEAEDGRHTVYVTVYATGAADAPLVFLPRTGITAREMGVLVNENDPQSQAVADAYLSRRKIPPQNVVRLSFPTGATTMSSADFAPLHAQAWSEAPAAVQAWAITWTTPYRVEGMAITSAFALGFDEEYYDDHPVLVCEATAAVAYADSDSVRPYDDFGIRPAMMLAGATLQDALDLIDRGSAADFQFPAGNGFLVRTTDMARSVRWPAMVSTIDDWSHAPAGLAMSYRDAVTAGDDEVVRNTDDLLFYLTGRATVAEIETNTYLPGAVCDHLTSFGGQLTDSGQMSILRWLEAGATASFGTVIEPCNFTQKFPDPRTLTSWYFRGQTVVEAYWKSVAWPGEGIFVGDPLARPWGRSFLERDGDTLTIRTTWLAPGRDYELAAADAPEGPFETVLAPIRVERHEFTTITLPEATRAVYRLAVAPP